MVVLRSVLTGLVFSFFVCLALAQAPLPLSRTNWCDPSPPQGWTDGNGNNADRCYDTGFACSGNDMGRLDVDGEYYLVAFSDIPDQLTFSLKNASMSGSSFLEVAVSSDNSSWTVLDQFGPCGGCSPISNCLPVTFDLDFDIRYVRWLLNKDIGNAGLDDVLITNGELSPEVGFVLPSSTTLEGHVGNHDHVIGIVMETPPSGPVEIQISDNLTGSASPDIDYTFLTTILTFETGDSYPNTQWVTITIYGDGLVEGDETVELRLDLLSGSADVVLTDHTVTILDDDVVSAWFRTATDGDWSDPGIWEVSADQGATWTNAGIAPVWDNSEHVTVLHTVVVDQDILIDDLVIDAGATLELPANHQLEIASSGPAPQCLLEGTLIDQGTGGANGLRFQSGARWLMGDAGTLVKTGNSASSEYRDHYLNSPGSPVLPPGSTVIYRYEGNTLSVSSSDWSYGQLVFESMAGHYNFNGLTSRINEFGTLTVQQVLDIGGEGTGTVTVHNQKQNLYLQGDLVVRLNCVLTNESYNGNTPHGLLLESMGAGMQLDGILQHTFGNGNVRFGQPAVVEGNEDHFRTTQLTIGAEVIFMLHAIVTNTLSFEGGDNVITGGLSEIRLQTSVPASILNFGPDAYVEGRLRRDLLSSTNGYDFPVGNAAHYAPFLLDVTTTDAQNVLGYFDPVGQAPGPASCTNPSPGVPAGDYDYQVYSGGWELVPDGGMTHELQVTVDPVLAMAPWYTLALDSDFDPCPTGLSRTINDLKRIDLYGADQPLPVTWVNFQAVPFGQGVRLIWSTALEKNNNYFTAEHSLDGHVFDGIGQMASASIGPGIQEYVFDHLTPDAGLNYYRIRQEDVDGSYSYSTIRVVNIQLDETAWQISGPGMDRQIDLSSIGLQSGDVRLKVVDQLGRIWLSRSVDQHIIFSTAEWPPGRYFLMLSHSGRVTVLPLFLMP